MARPDPTTRSADDPLGQISTIWAADGVEGVLPADLRAFRVSDAQVLRDRVRLLLDSIPLALVSSYLAAGLTAWLLYPEIALTKLLGWLAVLGAVHVVRVVAWRRARRSRDEAPLRRYLTRLRLGVFATALTWAALPAFLYPAADFDQVRLVTVIGAICGAGASELASDALSASLFVVPTLGVTVARLLADPLPAMRVLGILAAIYALYLVKAARKTERMFLEISYLRAKAADKIAVDEVTGIPNRIGLNRMLREALGRAQRRGAQLGVGYLDVDDFKPLNDAHGHAAGDQLLRELARRLREQMRGDDVLARVSGDEFVVVLQASDAAHFDSELQSAVARLHRAVATPFALDDGQQVRLQLTMGVALYPRDARDADALLRLADAAMVQLKRRKDDRTSWWQLGVSRTVAPEIDAPLDAYGEEAARRLADIAPMLPQVIGQFIEELDASLARDPSSSAILDALSPEDRAGLRRRQAAYLGRLVSPALARRDLLAAAEHIGQVHALIGVNAAALVKASELFRDVLARRLASERLVPSRRYRLSKVVDARMQDDLQRQVTTIERINHVYLSFLSRERPAHGALWADAIRSELDALIELPGIAMATLSRLSAQGEMVLEHSSGVPHPSVAERMSGGDLRSSIDPTTPSGRTGTAIAWRTQAVHRIDSCLADPQLQDPVMRAWLDMAHDAGLQSSVSIPFVGRDGHVEGVLTVYGRHPRQFASPSMQEWSLSMQRRMESVWSRCRASGGAVVSRELALQYRDRLFSGGLEMHYQPIVDLQSGQVTKVEALARLRMPDGRIVAPGSFIPLLGDNELARVFRDGLDQSLAMLRSWQAEGRSVDVSLNLPPSVLSDAHCAEWIANALHLHGVPASRLSLELLEIQLVDDAEQGQVLERLRALGVGMAMDDFGSGYSNVHRLSSVSFDAIKIDQNLTRQLEANPLQNTTLFGTLIQLVRDLGKSAVVEGLETPAHVEAAAVLGAQYGQGYALARPLPAHEIGGWIRDFELPVSPGGALLRTNLGALAFHWQYTDVGGDLHPGPEAQCPLHRFLVEQGLADSEAARWHARLHGSRGAETTDAARKLSRWLAARVAADRQAADAAA